MRVRLPLLRVAAKLLLGAVGLTAYGKVDSLIPLAQQQVPDFSTGLGIQNKKFVS